MKGKKKINKWNGENWIGGERRERETLEKWGKLNERVTTTNTTTLMESQSENTPTTVSQVSQVSPIGCQ